MSLGTNEAENLKLNPKVKAQQSLLRTRPARASGVVEGRRRKFSRCACANERPGDVADVPRETALRPEEPASEAFFGVRTRIELRGGSDSWPRRKPDP